MHRHSALRHTTTDSLKLHCKNTKRTGLQRPLLRNTMAVLLCGGVLCTAAQASEMRYNVEPGDTLIGIGHQLLARPGNWVILQELNQISNDRRIPIGFQMRIPVRLLRPEPLNAEVVAVRGEAQADGVALTPGDRLSAGASIATADQSHVILRLPDGSELSLPARSSAQIHTLQGYAGIDDQDVRLRLDEGRVESRVAPQRGPAARYRIDTPTAVIGVRSTDFRVTSDAANNESRAEVTEGSVRVDASRSSQARKLNQGFGLVARAGTALAAPVPLLPAPSIEGLPTLFEHPLIRISPPRAENAVATRVQVRALDGGVPLFDEVVTEEARIANLEDGQYRLQLRALDPSLIEGLDAEYLFTLKARPEPPFQSMPRHQGKAPAGQVDFEWAQVPEAATYHLQVSRDTSFLQPIHDDSSLDSVRSKVELEPGTHFWRIASIRPDGDRGPWSDPAAFDVRPPPAEPEPPEIGEDEIIFRWSSEPGQRFDIEFARDQAFSELILSASTDAPEWAMSKPGPDAYWLRVRAIDADGFVGPWTSAQQIIVPSSIPRWMFLIPLLAL